MFVKKPVFKIVNGSSATQAGVSNAASLGTSSLLSAASGAADLVPFDSDELFGALHFRLYEAGRAERRARWFGGRLYNRFSGADPDYIPVSGVHLVQVLDAAGIDAPDFVKARGKYLLRHDYAKQAYDTLARERVAPAV